MNVDKFFSAVSIYNLPKSLKKEQKGITEVITAGTNSVIAVVPTSCGKDLLYTLLPLLLEEVRWCLLCL